MNENIRMVKTKDQCCGCGACAHICTQDAIYMQEDKEGFLYAFVEEAKCVNCNMCINMCSFKEGTQLNEVAHDILAVKHKLDKVRMNSSSGGVFTAISDYVLDRRGAVYGAVLDENKEVVHIGTYNALERDQMRGSKYVQSKILDVFPGILEDLKTGKIVLFSGTPCQVAAVKSYITNVDLKLLNYAIFCDVICHGVASPQLWKEHIDSLVEKNGVIERYFFRSKGSRNGGIVEGVQYVNGKQDFSSEDIGKHIQLFFRDIALRPSCYSCVYARSERCGDVTLADCWKGERAIPEFYDKKGISLVLVNTVQGRTLLRDMMNDIESLPIEEIPKGSQPNLCKPTKEPHYREQFWNDYYNHGYDYILEKYVKNTIADKLKYTLAKYLSKIGLLEMAISIKRKLLG